MTKEQFNQIVKDSEGFALIGGDWRANDLRGAEYGHYIARQFGSQIAVHRFIPDEEGRIGHGYVAVLQPDDLAEFAGEHCDKPKEKASDPHPADALNALRAIVYASTPFEQAKAIVAAGLVLHPEEK